VLVIDALKVAEQLDVLLEDITPQAAKTGALGDEKIFAV
jgi:hydroxymethylpyrimidine/phosphomethylpyrimidine kinase